MLRTGVSGSSQATTSIVLSAARRVGGKRTSLASRRLLSSSHSTLTTLTRPPTGRHSASSYTTNRRTTNHAHTHQRHGFHASSVVEKRRETFNLADIGEGITECEVIKWSLPPGTRISAFDPLCEVQSDKATVEITSPFDGVILELLVKEGEIAKVGAGLCIIEVDNEESGEHGSADPASSTEVESNANTTSLDAKLAEEQNALAASPAAPSPTQEKKRKHPLDPSNPAPRKLEDLRLGSHKGKSLFGRNLDSFNDNGSLTSPTQGFSPSASNAPTVLAPPSIRHLAKTLGVDLSLLVPGSGKEGRIEKPDLDAYLSRHQSSTTPSEAKTGVPPSVNNAKAGAGEDVVVELGRTRWNMYRAMEKSLSIPHFGYTTELDITELHALLPLLNENIPARYLPPSIRSQREAPAIKFGMVNPLAILPKDVQAQGPLGEVEIDEPGQYTKLTYLPILLKTLSKAMMEWPLLRSSITSPTEGASGKPTLSVRQGADINLALSTPTGLYTPTLVGAEGRSVYELASRVKELSWLGRQVPCALTPTHMPRRGGTLTLSNVGAIGAGHDASPVLVPGGGVAIVALGRARWTLDVSDQYYNADKGKLGERRLKLPVSWSADHRVVEGAELAAFVESWRGWVEKPGRLVGEGV